MRASKRKHEMRNSKDIAVYLLFQLSKMNFKRASLHFFNYQELFFAPPCKNKSSGIDFFVSFFVILHLMIC